MLPFPRLIILKSALFRGLRVYELKFRSKKDNGIIFFPVKAEVLIVSNLIPGGIQEASRSYILIWNFENFQKNTKFSNQNRASGGLLEASWVSDLDNGTSKLSLEKNYPSILFRKNFRFCNVSCIKVSMDTHFQMCYICRFFNTFWKKVKTSN